MTKQLDPMDQALVDILTKSTAAVGDAIDTAKVVTTKTIDFVSAQAPELIQQLLTWKLVEAWFTVALATIGLIALGTLTKKAWEATDGAVGILTVIGGIPLLALFVSGFHDVLYIVYAPKIYLIEYASNLMTGR